MAERVNRKYDLAAYAAIVEAVNGKGSLTLDMGSEAACKGLRLMFYKWRKQEQELNADPTFLSGYVVRVTGSTITFAGGLANPDLRNALALAGIKVSELESDEEI